MRLAVFPEGPMSFDGKRVLYSEGEGSYIDSLARRVDEVVVFAYWFRPGSPWYEGGAHYKFVSENINFIELPLNETTSFFSKVMQLLKVSKIIYSNFRRVDVLYLFIPGYPSAIAFLINRLFGKPYFVYAASDWSPEESRLIFRWTKGIGKYALGLYSKINLWLERELVRSAIFTVAASEKCITRYSKYTEAVYKTVPRINRVELSMYYREDSCQGRRITLLFVGGLYLRKGIEYLLEAVASLHPQYPLSLVIVGEGEDREYFEKRSSDMGVASIVSFRGHLPYGPALMNEFKQADIFVFPSLGEGFPRVLYEAMTHGLPIVATDVGGVALEVIDGARGMLVPPADANALAQNIVKIIEDGDLRRRLIVNSLKHMESSLKDSDGGVQIAGLYEKHRGNCDIELKGE